MYIKNTEGLRKVLYRAIEPHGCTTRDNKSIENLKNIIKVIPSDVMIKVIERHYDCREYSIKQICDICREELKIRQVEVDEYYG